MNIQHPNRTHRHDNPLQHVGPIVDRIAAQQSAPVSPTATAAAQRSHQYGSRISLHASMVCRVERNPARGFRAGVAGVFGRQINDGWIIVAAACERRCAGQPIGRRFAGERCQADEPVPVSSECLSNGEVLRSCTE